MEEIFKSVKGFEGLYKVSNLSKIKNGNGIKSDNKISNSGYRMVQLWKNNKRTMKYVHILVAESFLGYEPNGPASEFVVDHIDGNKLNNISTNLRVITKRENSIGRYKTTSSRYRGSSWSKYRKQWRASIYFKGKAIHLGFFDDEKEAGDIYKKAIESIENGLPIERKVKPKSSEQRGVRYNSKKDKWSVIFPVDGKRKSFGTFKTEPEAIEIAKKYLNE